MRNFRWIRAELSEASPTSLRDLYRALDLPGTDRLRGPQAAPDMAVGEAYRYGIPPEIRGLELLSFLLALNQRCAAAERKGQTVVGPDRRRRRRPTPQPHLKRTSRPL